MKIFFYMGRNPENKGGLSWKIWKIQRRGRAVTVFWGPAKLHKRRPKLVGAAQERTFRFDSLAKAEEFQKKRIQSKESKGYERSTRWRDK